MVNVRDDAKIADETWVHQLARRRKNLAAVKVLLELAAIGYVCADCLRRNLHQSLIYDRAIQCATSGVAPKAVCPRFGTFGA